MPFEFATATEVVFGRGTFDGHHLRGMIVALVRDRDRPVLPLDLRETDDPGVFARTHDHISRLGRQVLLEHATAALV